MPPTAIERPRLVTLVFLWLFFALPMLLALTLLVLWMAKLYSSRRLFADAANIVMVLAALMIAIPVASLCGLIVYRATRNYRRVQGPNTANRKRKISII